MTSEEKETIRAKITATLSELDGKIVELKELTQPISPENAIGRVSRMDAINNKSVNEAALRQSEFKRKRLAHSLTRIDEPDFGNCVRCSTPIPLGRLMLMPESTRCVHCAER